MNRSTPLHRLESLLSSPALHIGANRIHSHGVEILGPCSVHVFVGHAESLALELNELILLDYTEREANQSTSEMRALVEKALSQLVDRFGVSHIWYIAADFHGITTERHGLYTVSMAGPNELAGLILTLPSTFSEMVASDVDTNGPIFRDAFQRRIASSPAPVFPTSNEEFLGSLDDELTRWASSGRVELPLLLLGDRGSGKTWQLLKFCEEQYERSQQSRGLHSPAFYVSLRGVFSYLTDVRRSSLGLYGLLTEHHPWFSVKWNWAMFQALLECGQVIICLDGFDEVEVQPSEDAVQEHLRRIVGMLPMGSRFVISSRTTHFSSFDRLYSLESWPGVNVGGSFRILDLAPFQKENLSAYAAVVAGSDPASDSVQRLKNLLQNDSRCDELTTALRRCGKQPALLARLVNEVKSNPSVTEFELVQRAIEGSLIEFNVEFERTRPLHLDSRGELRVFDARARVEFLGELAWFMAERHLAIIDLGRLPARLIRMFGLDSDALRRDIRSQTVFELVEPGNLPTDNGSEEGLESVGATVPESAPASVRFGFCINDEVDMLMDTESKDSHLLPRAPKSRVFFADSPKPSESVAASYFLASHIAARLVDSDYVRGLKLADTLKFLGLVRLDKMTAAILREMLGKKLDHLGGHSKLVDEATKLILNLAAQGNARVFNHSIRFLMQNLEALGYVTATVRGELDPWTPTLANILAHTTALGAYEFVLVPGIFSRKIANIVREATVEESAAPFLMGVHEITNEQFARFIMSKEGAEWAVERVTRAASDGSNPPSPFAARTNEYHLYFWEEVPATPGTFKPPSPILRHPVVYVSWYAAQAYCNWLSSRDGREPVYPFERADADSQLRRSSLPGFRLPTAAEWWWSSQGPADRAEYPWEILPYDCALADVARPPANDSPKDNAAQQWFRRYRDAAAEVLLDSGRRSAEVAYDDEAGPFGAIGLIGNVKEWVQDRIEEGSSRTKKALVCGATAHLGKPSFRIGYYATLFPENTNPDVGFRIARSLASSEAAAFEKRERELAKLLR